MWSGLHASTSDSMSSMTAKETKILHAKGPKKTLQNPWFPPPFFSITLLPITIIFLPNFYKSSPIHLPASRHSRTPVILNPHSSKKDGFKFWLN